MKKLRISADLSWPLSFITQTQAILAKKRSGKSYLAAVQAEELLKAKQQVVIIDPTGAHSGLRSSANGKSAGYSILVAGGERGDIQLEESAGEVMAEAIVADKFSCILDLSLLRKGASHRFLAPFLETLYRKNREAMHLFCDEADFYAPQKSFGEELRTLGAMSDVVRRGGIRGIGCTLITQRPAVLNKDVLTQCEILTCLRIVHHRDISAIKEWIEVHGDPNQAKQMIVDLPSLPIGTAWIWSPAWPDEDGIFQRVKIRKRETFDSGATPKPGEHKRRAKVLAKIDVKKLGKAISDTVERVKENDPKELKKKIADLENAVKHRDMINRQLVAENEKLKQKCVSLQQGGFRERTKPLPFAETTNPKLTFDNSKKNLFDNSKYRTHTNNGHQPYLPPGEKATLAACIQFPEGLPRRNISVLTGYKRSSRDAYIARLVQKGYVTTNRDLILATPEGIAALPDYEPLPTGTDLQEYWMRELPEGEKEVLRLLIDAYPKEVVRDEIDRATGYKRSTRDAYLARLGAKMLLSEDTSRGMVKASENLF